MPDTVGMEYELAKELKDMGFPQGTTVDANRYNHLAPDGNPTAPYLIDCAYIPTLEELIEACGGFAFKLLKLPGERWFAEESGDNAYGSTPLEAVARLYLALNKKV
jgi:hypothetical protein